MIKLGDFIAREAGVSIDSVMLLRHSQRIVDHLRSRGVTIHDYTIVQPIGKRYDYRDPRKPRIDIVVVIVGNKVDTIYRVLGVDVENDTTYALNVSALTQHDKETGKPSRPARRFKMAPLQSAALSHAITGWERRQRTPVQRSSDAFFNEIEVDLPDALRSEAEVSAELEKNVQRSLRDSPAVRRRRLAVASKIPVRIEVRSTAFLRNSDVIAEVLARAKGRCELCTEPAPFARKRDGTPYLEVHHKIRLADRGKDTVENAIALCPNCHRREHYG